MKQAILVKNQTIEAFVRDALETAVAAVASEQHPNDFFTVAVPSRLQDQLRAISAANDINISDLTAILIERALAVLASGDAQVGAPHILDNLSRMNLFPSGVIQGDNVATNPVIAERLWELIKELQKIHGELVHPNPASPPAEGKHRDEERTAAFREATNAIRHADLSVEAARSAGESSKSNLKSTVRIGRQRGETK